MDGLDRFQRCFGDVFLCCEGIAGEGGGDGAGECAGDEWVVQALHVFTP